jgi:tRNA1(Val) A37 N6-methylase TrmN6
MTITGQPDKARDIMTFTLDSIISPEFKFYQPARGYRTNIDTIILYDFAMRHIHGSVLEIGSASGVTSILLSGHDKVTGITGIEIDETLHEASLKNLELHACKNTVRFIHGDINGYKKFFKPQSFHAIVTNPPFYRYGTGRASTRRGIDSSHSDQYLTIEDIFKAARYLLKPKGHLLLLFLTYRISDIFLNAKGFGIEVLRFIRRAGNRSSDVFLMLARKGGGKQLNVVPPLIVHEGNGYSAEITAMLNSKLKIQNSKFKIQY